MWSSITKAPVQLGTAGSGDGPATVLPDCWSQATQGKATLHEISRVMGLPGKPKGFDGGEVERYFHEGKIKEIADYCETDVVGKARSEVANDDEIVFYLA